MCFMEGKSLSELQQMVEQFQDRHQETMMTPRTLLPVRHIVPFHGTFSRHGKVQASLALLIWLNENVLFHSTFSRHGKAQASLALLIWLNENVLF